MGFLALQIKVEGRRSSQLKQKDPVSLQALKQFAVFCFFSPLYPALETLLRSREGFCRRTAALPAREGQNKLLPPERRDTDTFSG